MVATFRCTIVSGTSAVVVLLAVVVDVAREVRVSSQIFSRFLSSYVL